MCISHISFKLKLKLLSQLIRYGTVCVVELANKELRYIHFRADELGVYVCNLLLLSTYILNIKFSVISCHGNHIFVIKQWLNINLFDRLILL